MAKPLIYDLDITDLTGILESWGQPKFRARQIWQGLYQSLWSAPEEFSNLPKELRQRLEAEFSFSYLEPVTMLNSTDGDTQKTLFHLPDGRPIETVRMRYETYGSAGRDRRTLCISTQSGFCLLDK